MPGPGDVDNRHDARVELVETPLDEQAELEPSVIAPTVSNADIASAARSARAGRERASEKQEVVQDRREFTADGAGAEAPPADAKPPSSDDDDAGVGAVEGQTWMAIAAAPPPPTIAKKSQVGSWLTPRKPKE